MKKIANTIAVVFILISVFMFIEAGSFPPGSNGALGPGFFPRVLSVLVVFLSVLELVNSRNAQVPEGQEKVLLFKKENARVWISMLISILYIFGLKYIGFIIMTPVYLFVMLWYYKIRNKALLISVPLGIMGVLYVVFTILLHVKLPAGMIF